MVAYGVDIGEVSSVLAAGLQGLSLAVLTTAPHCRSASIGSRRAARWAG